MSFGLIQLLPDGCVFFADDRPLMVNGGTPPDEARIIEVTPEVYAVRMGLVDPPLLSVAELQGLVSPPYATIENRINEAFGQAFAAALPRIGDLRAFAETPFACAGLLVGGLYRAQPFALMVGRAVDLFGDTRPFVESITIPGKKVVVGGGGSSIHVNDELNAFARKTHWDADSPLCVNWWCNQFLAAVRRGIAIEAKVNIHVGGNPSWVVLREGFEAAKHEEAKQYGRQQTGRP
jgi:hypothetical protein